MDITVIIPSLNPDEKLMRVVQGMLDAGFTDVLLVNDGSDQAHEEPFRQAAALPGVTVLRHEVNRGKGRALKTAFAYVREHRPDSRGVVTVDGDGQHGAEDVRRLAEALLADDSRLYLGVRDFSRPEVPSRSRFGNRTTSLAFRLLCGLRISDTQTGLRGIPRRFLEPLEQVAGERFEYETNMLLELRRLRIPYTELPIETIYIEENQTSHFRPVRDSVRIYWLILRHFIGYMGASLGCFVLDLALFTLCGKLLFAGLPEAVQILWSTVVARVCSSLVNFTLNRKAVFRSNESLLQTLWKYYALCICQMLASAGAVAGVCALLPLDQTVAKLLVDVVLFCISYQIQRRVVFKV